MDAYLYDAVRTPRGVGKPGGSLHPFTPLYLLTHLLHAIERRGLSDFRLVEDLILGVVDPIAEQGGNLARMAALEASLPLTVPGVQINRFCASGLEAINMAASKVMSGQTAAVIAGGVETMSRIPMMASGNPWMLDPSLAIPGCAIPQGVSADLIATLNGYEREDLDAFGLSSQQKAAKAWNENRFERAIVPVYTHSGALALAHDELIRKDMDMVALSKLRPAFQSIGQDYGYDAVAIQKYPELEAIKHGHHAGNSSGIVDGAALTLIGSKAFGEQIGLKPRARIRAFASIGSEPTIMLTGPKAASEKALAKAGMNVKDIDLFEVNEAFASVVLYYMQSLEIEPDKVNVNGGAIAMGHPLGATGAMLAGTLVDELERADLNTGLVTLCAGGGMATTTIFERI